MGNNIFSFKIFYKQFLQQQQQNTIEELALSCSKNGDVIPLLFLLLYGYNKIYNWYTIFDSLSFDISLSIIFPVVDEYGYIGFVLNNNYVSYSPIEIIDYLRKTII